MRKALIILVVVATSVLGMLPAARATVLGGNPGKFVYYPYDGHQIDGTEPSLAISSTGKIYTLVNREIDLDTSELVILRSDDHGATWMTWDVVSAPGTEYKDARLQISSGLFDEWVFLSFYADAGDGTIWVWRSQVDLPTPFWTQTVVDTFPDVPGVLPRVDGLTVALRTSATQYIDVAVAYAVETDIEDWELRYSLSEDAATVFTAPVVIYDFPPLASGITRTMALSLGFGGGATVNLAGLRTVLDCGNDLMQINFARATSNGITLADWPAPATLVVADTTWGYSGLSLASDQHGDDVVIGYHKDSSPNLGATVVGSLDGGATWSPATLEGPTIRNHLRLFWTAYGVMGTMCDYAGYYVLRPDSGPLGTYETAQYLANGHLLTQPAALALDPSQGNQTAIAAVMQVDAHDEAPLLFNAAWRTSPGFAVAKDGGFFTLGGNTTHYVSAPGVADLDDDGVKDVVAVDSDGFVRRYALGAGTVASYGMGAAGDCSLPVLFDLDSDGVREVVVGDTNGRVHALDSALVPLPSFPRDLGTGSDTYVSVGPITGFYAGEIVAASGNQVHLLNSAGNERPGWPVTFPGAQVLGRAAIGDLNGDGAPEVVAALNTGVAIIESDGSVHDFLLGSGAAPSGGVTLSDLDGDGNLEIAVPMSTGRVQLLNRDGSAVNGAWPYNTGTGSPILGVTVAGVENATDPVLCFSTRSGSVFAVNVDGTLLAGYPVTVGPADNASTEPIIGRVARPGIDRPQLLVGTTGGWLHEWAAQATIPADWPNLFDLETAQSAVVTDIENDGIADLVITVGRFLYVCGTGTDALAGATRRWAMAGHDLARTGCTEGVPAQATGVEDPQPQVSQTRVSFRGAFPNPAPGRTTFGFSLPAGESVALAVYDIRGRRVRDFGRQDFAAGDHAVAWDGRDAHGATVASGVYVARMVVGQGAGRRVVTRQLMVQK